MSRFWAIVGGVVAAAAVLVMPVGARVQAASGDTCTASGNGTQYTVRINIPAGGQQQYGFAFRVDGGSITNVSIPGANGNFSTAVETLAPNTTAAWLSDAPVPANSVITVTTSGALKALTVVPSFDTSKVNGGSTPATGQTSGATGPSYFDPVTCTMTAVVPDRTATFTVGSRAAYSASLKGWRLAVKVNQPGIVSAVQLVPTLGTAYAKAATKKPLVQAHRVNPKPAGTVMLTLKPTSRGQAALEEKGSFKVPLRVTFNAENGKSAQKNVTLTLRA